MADRTFDDIDELLQVHEVAGGLAGRMRIRRDRCHELPPIFDEVVSQGA